LNLGHLDFDIVSNFVLRISYFSYRDTNFPSTFVESALQISPFLTNKPNLLNAQMNVSRVSTRDYEKMTLGERGKNKANSNPIQTQTKPISEKAEMNVNKVLAKDYENKPRFRPNQNKPNTKPIQTQSLVKDLIALVKKSCARLWALLQCFSENCDTPGERKAECSARPKLRTDPKNLLGTMPAKEGKVDLKHSFYGSAFCFMVNGFN